MGVRSELFHVEHWWRRPTLWTPVAEDARTRMHYSPPRITYPRIPVHLNWLIYAQEHLRTPASALLAFRYSPAMDALLHP